MSWLNRLWRGAAEKSAPATARIVLDMLRGSRSGPWSFAQAGREAYRLNVVAYRCVSLIARSAAAVPWVLYSKTGTKRVELDTHPLLDLLRRPNPEQSGTALMEMLVSYLVLGGNAYLLAVGADGQAPVRLIGLRPDRMMVRLDAAGKFYDYLGTTADGTALTWRPDPVSGRMPLLHLRRFAPADECYGQGDAEPAALAIDQHNEAAAWNFALLRNGARPSGALVYNPKEGPALLADQQFDRLKAEIDRQYAGAANAGRPLLLEGGLDYKEMGLSPKDMDWSGMKDSVAIDIATAFGVPAQLIGIRGAQSYANFAEARLALWEDTVLPLVNLLRAEFNAQLVSRFGGDLELGFDPDEIPALAERRLSVFTKLETASFLTVNEKRLAAGYAPLPSGDVLLRPASTLAEAAPANPPPTKGLAP